MQFPNVTSTFVSVPQDTAAVLPGHVVFQAVSPLAPATSAFQLSHAHCPSIPIFAMVQEGLPSGVPQGLPFPRPSTGQLGFNLIPVAQVLQPAAAAAAVPAIAQPVSASPQTSLPSSSDTQAEDINEPAPLRTAKNTSISGLAGAIAKRLRGLSVAEILAMGPSCIHTTVRALTLAWAFLKVDKLTILVRPELCHWGTTTSEETKQAIRSEGLRFRAKTRPLEMVEDRPQPDVFLKVHSASIVRKTTSALVKAVQGNREEEVLAVQCTGSEAINIAIRAIASASIASGKDIYFHPTFLNPTSSPDSEDTTRCVVNLALFPSDV
eukprot:Sspe_Gene.12981::Locus_4445_Transcript_2_2_Confidence_0.667_Length_1201::g.12981::m.12981